MGFGRLPTGIVREETRHRQETYTVYRPTDTTSGWGERADDYETDVDGNHPTAKLDLFGPQRAEVQRPSGEGVNVSLRGLCLPDADIEEDDLVRYNGEVMECVNKTPYPAKNAVSFYRLVFRDRDDVSPP